MAYCDGETLKKRLESGPLPAAEAIRVALQVARGLARAHQAGIVHRDVKPGNIMVTTEGEAKLLDFGIAKTTEVDDLTRTGTTLGTIAYMAPEHVRGGGADERSDVWALGVVLYEMLAGRRPFSGADDYELLQAIVDRPQSPLTGVAGVTDDIARVVERALDKARERRYANAGEFVHALERACRNGSRIRRSRPDPRPALAQPMGDRRPRGRRRRGCGGRCPVGVALERDALGAQRGLPESCGSPTSIATVKRFSWRRRRRPASRAIRC